MASSVCRTQPAVPAKLSAPRLAAVHPRPRLFKLLDRALRRPIGWIEGPAGAGKTTLAASWLAARQRRALWYQLDARDRDPATFFFFLRQAAERFAPRRGAPLPLLTPEYLQGLPTYVRNFFERLFERLRAPAVLVLDDFQSLPEDSVLHQLLPEALAAAPEGIQVLVLSRAGPSRSFSRQRANAQLGVVGWGDLRFTLSEARGLLVEHGLPRPSPRELAALHRRTAGWAAGLTLMMERARGAPTPAERPASPEVFDYFASEIFDRTDSDTQRLLLTTAFLPDTTAEVAAALSDNGSAGAVLERLSRQHYFTGRHAGPPPVYRYHPLFREFLLARAAAAFGSEQCATIRRRAAELLHGAGRDEEAIALLLEAGDWQAAGAGIARLAPALLAQGRALTIEGWIAAVPAPVREQQPWLLLWLGACRLARDPSESLALAERAYHAFDAAGDEAGALLAWSGAVTAIHLSWRDLSELDPWLARLDERLARRPAFPSPELELRVLAAEMIPLLWRQPAHPDIARRADRLLELLRDSQDPNLRVGGYVSLAWFHQWRGDGDRLAEVLEQLERVVYAGRAMPAVRIGGLWFESFVCHFTASDPERSLQGVTQALALAEAEGVHVYDHWLHAQGAAALLSRGDLAGADRHLAQMRHSVDTSGTMSGQYHHLRAWRAALAGDLTAALAHAERALQISEAAGFKLVEPQCHYALAQLRHALGQGEAAQAHLATAARAAGETHSTFFEFACLLAEAQLALERGDEPAGLTALRRGLALGRERGFTNLPWWPASLALPRVCAAALEAGVETRYVRELIRLHDLGPAPSWPGIPEAWPFALRVRALGRFALSREERPVDAEGQGRTKPLLLLQALVALGATEVPEAQLVECLWPDAEGDRARHSLKFTVHALRRLLGREDALVAKMGHYGLDPRVVWLDVWELHRAAAAVERAQRRTDPRALRAALEALVGLYRGPLLQSETAPWALAARERLRRKFLRVVTAGADALSSGDPAATISVCERTLEADPLAERIYRTLLRCHHALGQVAEGVAVYQRCAEALRRDLDLAPSPATEALYLALRAR